MFNNLKRLRVEEGATSPLVLNEVVLPPAQKPVVLHLAPAEGTYNPAFKKAVAELTGEPMVKEEVDPKLYTAQANSRTARVYGRAIIVGWENVYNDAGVAVDFTPDEGYDFMLALTENAPDIAKAVMLHAGDMSNFRIPTAGTAPKG